MRAGLIHFSFRVFGGAEAYASNILRVLDKLGFKNTVYTLNCSSIYKHLSGLEDAECTSLQPLLRTGTFYDFIFGTYSLSRALESIRKDADLVVNTKANEAPVPGDICVVHYPLGHVLYYWDRVVLGAGVDPKYIRGFWKLYIQPFRKWFYRLSDRGLRSCRVTVANSSWTARLLEKLAGIRSFVIYPPVKLNGLSYTGLCEGKERLIVTISRFEPSKRLENVLYVARRVPRAKFIVIGRLESRAYNYYRRIKELRRRLGLRNVFLLPNLGEEEKRELLTHARVYFHPVIGEHFGISVLEGLAYGAVPVVHRDSGACLDIVNRIGVGYCYDSLEEAAEYIEEILDTKPQCEDLVRARQILEKVFSFETFEKKWSSLILSLLDLGPGRRA